MNRPVLSFILPDCLMGSAVLALILPDCSMGSACLAFINYEYATPPNYETSQLRKLSYKVLIDVKEDAKECKEMFEMKVK